MDIILWYQSFADLYDKSYILVDDKIRLCTSGLGRSQTGTSHAYFCVYLCNGRIFRSLIGFLLFL